MSIYSGKVADIDNDGDQDMVCQQELERATTRNMGEFDSKCQIRD
jgi:hypothetical protein